MKKHTFLLIPLLILSLTIEAQTLDSSMGGNTLDSAFTAPGGLTDQQAKEAQNFVHQGRKDALLEKACKNADGACDPYGPDNTKVLLPTMLEDNLGKLYTLFFGGMSLLSGGPKLKLKDKKDNAGTDPAPQTDAAAETTEAPPAKDAGKNKGREGADYCMYGALLYEGVATVIQVGQQNKAAAETANLNDPQLSALVNLKETHKARKRTATYQSAVYGATSACYVAQMLLRPVQVDAKYIIKMTAAAGISALYTAKASKHGNAMKKIQEVIDSMPKAGDCNPWTGTSCFCKEPTSQQLYPGQYMEVCVLNNGIADGPKADLGCGVLVNNQVQFDEKCDCKATNTCVTASLKFGNPTIGLGSNFLNTANAGFALLDPSQFDEAKLTDFANGAAAMNGQVKTKTRIPDVQLTDEQKKIADSLKDVVPPAIANMAATMPTSPIEADSQLAPAASSGLSALPETIKKQLSSPEISGNYKSGGGRTTFSDDDGPGFVMPPIPGQQPAGPPATEVLTFAERAVSNADVTNRPDTPIFDIISNRYRSSGMKRLSLE